MPRSGVYRKSGSSGEVSINMTPMIDIVFQLIIFFIITSVYASDDISNLLLPSPYQRDDALVPTKELKKNRKVIINVTSKEDPDYRKEGESYKPGDMAFYNIGGTKFDELGEAINKNLKDPEDAGKVLTTEAMLRQEYNRAVADGAEEGFFAEIRADYRVNYDYVAKVLSAAGRAGIKKAYMGVMRHGEVEDKIGKAGA